MKKLSYSQKMLVIGVVSTFLGVGFFAFAVRALLAIIAAAK